MSGADSRNRILVLSVTGGVIVTVLGLVFSGMLAIRAGHTTAMSSKHYSDQDVRDTRDWWNPDRMDQAKPVGPQVTPGDQGQPGTGQPGTDHRMPPRESASPVSAPYSGTENSIRGKVFFMVPGGMAECSATVVHHPSGNVVWTAAHCLHGGKDGDFYSKVTFIPGYDGTATTRAQREPYGRWPARSLRVDAHWVRDADPERESSASPYDFGAFTVDSQNGRTLEDVVGQGADILWNAPRHLTVDSYGYPGEEPFDGTELYRCSSPTTDFPNEPDWGGPEMLWMGCNMTGGSSGGGWFATYQGHRYLVSNVSLGVTTPTRPTMTGPYLGDVAHTLYNQFPT